MLLKPAAAAWQLKTGIMQFFFNGVSTVVGQVTAYLSPIGRGCVRDRTDSGGGAAHDILCRVGNSYHLNLVGLGTPQAIASFELEQELLRVFADKALIGAKLHSDYCLVGGRSVSDWLFSPGEIADLLRTLQSAGWTRRGESPERSRFWHLLTDEQAPMFGVFEGYEQQLLRDRIMDDAVTKPTARTTNRFRRRQTNGHVEEAAAAPQRGTTIEQIIAHHVRGGPRHGSCANVDILFQQLAGVDTKAEAFAVLGGMLSLANHPTPAGLAVTKLYADLFSRLP